MTDADLIQLLTDMTQSVIFLWLFLRERRRASELADSRIADYKDWQLRMLGIIDKNLPGAQNINK